MDFASDARRMAPAAGRNRDPILSVLRRVLPLKGLVLEIASGTGEHAVYFARHLPGIVWQPSDPDAESRQSIAAWARESDLANVRPPLELNAAAPSWPISHADAVVCINMVHISPWTATEGLLSGAARVLPSGGVLYLYGPYKRDGRHTAPSNEAFDRDLRQRNRDWGVRDVAEVRNVASVFGLRFQEIVEMPANNLSVIFTRN
jgi:SAM-dependent methyltransferase